MASPIPPKTTDGQGHLLWGGRFSAKPDALMQAINVSIGFDRRLYALGGRIRNPR